MAQDISNIWCVGRNYAEHAKELGNNPPQEPLIFLKSGSTLVNEGCKFSLPDWSKDIQHEVEVAYQFDKTLSLSHVGVAIDLTARDIQSSLKKNGYPWTLAKSFKDSCLISKLIPVTQLHFDPNHIEFRLKVNNQVRQSGVTTDMIFTPDTLSKYVASHFPVCPGDLLLTGTPAGVSKLNPGDVLLAEIIGEIRAEWTVSK